MTLEGLKTYFENLAIHHIELQHNPDDDTKASFFCMNIEKNTDEFIRNNPLDLIMILLVPDKNLHRDGANYSWSKHVAYLVLRRVDDKTNANIIAAQNTTEIIAGDIVTRIIADRHSLIDSIEDGSLNMEPVGPMGNQHYGHITMFKLVDLFDEQVDESRWIG